jgi:sugar-specific transcriptional regulator TrmB
MDPSNGGVQSLILLGFTSLEAEIYAALLQDSPATGYAIAKAIGKPVANVYKGIQTLHEKGTVSVDEGETRLCRPVPLDELLERLEREFRGRRDRAREALAQLPGPALDARVYHMRSREQVLERARRMLATATRVVLLDVFPEPLDALREELDAAARRGVEVAAKVYAPAELPGIETVLGVRAEQIRERWPGQWLNLVADGAQMLLALLRPDGQGVVQAVYSGSPYLCWVMHSSMACELGYTALERDLESRADLPVLRQTLQRARRYFTPDAPGYRLLVQALRPAPPPPEGAPHVPRSAAQPSDKENP